MMLREKTFSSDSRFRRVNPNPNPLLADDDDANEFTSTRG